MEAVIDLGTDLFGAPVLRRTAHFASPGVRIRLSRDWAPGPRALVIGCNPSTADADRDDPTVCWLIHWFRLFGFGGFDLMNLYPFCSSSPAECRRMADWEANGPDWYARDQLIYHNLPTLVRAAKRAKQVFACWGAIAWDDAWIEHVVEEMQTGVAPYPDLWCWGITAGGAPKHPMARGLHRIARDQKPILWRAVA